MSLTHSDSPEVAVSGAGNLSLIMSAMVGLVAQDAPAQQHPHTLQSRTTKASLVKANTGQAAQVHKHQWDMVERSTMVKNGLILQSRLLRIALLEDCQIEADGLARLFQENGYKVVSCGSGVDFLKILESESFDLLVLDWNVPDVSGIEVLHSVRNVLELTIPVMMLTSRASEYDIVQALNRGADDYLQKPWQPFEIIARVNAILRRQHIVKTLHDERYSDFVLEARLNQITYRGSTIQLSNKEFLLAQLLLRHMGSPVSRAHIAQTVWNDTHIEARTLDVHVSRLRQKLSLTVEKGFSLASIYGYGYRLEKLATPANPAPKLNRIEKNTKTPRLK